MDRAKALEKIKKCLALAGSNNANEAAVALRQAQRLMDQFGISEHDLQESDITETFWVIPFGPGHGDLDELETIFVGVIQKAFGVRAMHVTDTKHFSKPRRVVVFYGGRGRPELAEYAARLVWNTMANAWLDRLRTEQAAMAKLRTKMVVLDRSGKQIGTYVVKLPAGLRGEPVARKGKKGDRAAFFAGWLIGVWKNIEEIGFTDDEDEKLKRYAAKKCKPSEQDDKLDINRLVNMNPGLAMQAKAQGEQFKLHRPVGVSRKQIGKD